MPVYTLPFLLLLALALIAAQPAQARLLAPRQLRCEYLANPLAINTLHPRFSWEVRDASRGAMQSAFRVLVSGSLETLRVDRGDIWDSGKVKSGQSIQVAYEGKPLEAGNRYYWKVRTWDRAGKSSPWSRAAFFGMGLLRPGDWRALWIEHPQEDGQALPSPSMRKAFKVSGPVKRATLFASALGLYELRLNGRRVGESLLAPEWTDYRQRIQYQAYEVTSLLREGENVIGAALGEGWYAGRVGPASIVPGGPARGIYGPNPRLLAQLVVERADGTAEIIASDVSWRVTREGPIRSTDILDGESYDATRQMPGWDRPGFDDSSWSPAKTSPLTGAKIVAQPNEPIRITRTLKPAALTEPAPGVFIFDLGQNMVGWIRMRLQGKRGTAVTFRHAEMLNPDGTLYIANLREAAQTDRYIIRGRGREVFEPHFTYHGFRYVEVAGLERRPAQDDLTGCVFHSAAPEAGRFECSSPMLNRLWENIVWTQRANLHSSPTDCPQRDERLGWMGDIQAFSQTAAFNMDMAAFFTKWVPDIRDAQAEDGRFPDFAPHPFGPNERFSGAPAWGDAGTVVPWRAYVNYGDRRMLEEHFEAARRWVDYIRSRNPGLLWQNNRGNDYNDWLNGDTLIQQGWPITGGAVPNEILATAFFAHSAETVAKMAAAVGKEAEAEAYRTLFEAIKSAFNIAYVDAEGRVREDTQAGYALALAFNLLPESLRPAAARHMAEGIRRYGDHISTGIQTTHRLMLELTRNGYNDLAYQLINNRTFPSWGYSIENGATTVWERWDGYVAGRGFQNPGMNSFNHWALGAVGEWMYRVILGIEPDESRPGFKHFTLRPRPGGGLIWAKGQYRSIHGNIEVSWRLEKGVFSLDITIPANTTATLYVPTLDAEKVTESGLPASQAEGMNLLGMEDGAAVFEVGAGWYRVRM
ncbi:MAG: glycoside hydrolase family 78 protein [Armatimonadetes bacterium]|nr:glycoside hydrolase family 78 protein [Armatimonadota bacterium]